MSTASPSASPVPASGSDSDSPSLVQTPDRPRPLRPPSGSQTRDLSANSNPLTSPNSQVSTPAAGASSSSPNPYAQTHAHAAQYSGVRPSSRGAPGQGEQKFGYERPWVFLGGSCDPTTWRRDIAVPKLTKYKIPFFNPQVDDWSPEFIQLEAKAKEECEVLIFVIDSKTRAIASMLEAVEYIMSNRKVVLVILNIPEGTLVDGEVVGNRQLKDLNRGRAFLCDIAARHQKHCDVFDSIEQAINHVIMSHPAMSPKTSPSPRTPKP